MNDTGVFYFLGLITACVTTIVFFSIRGCMDGQLSHVKCGHYGYDGYIVEGETARKAHFMCNGDGKIVVTPSDGKPFFMILTSKIEKEMKNEQNSLHD